MKRSEAIKKIASQLRNNLNIKDINYFSIAIDLLEIIEEDIGMRPPYDANQDDETDFMEWDQE